MGGSCGGSAGEGVKRDMQFSQLSYCICTALEHSWEDKKTLTQYNQETNANVYWKDNTAARLMKHLTCTQINE